MSNDSKRKNTRPSRKPISRKEFLKTGALSSLAVGPALFTGSGRNRTALRDPGSAKNIIFMVSDGMSCGTLSLADQVRKRQFGKPTNWISIYNSDREYHRGLMDMTSNNSPVTDSAAAASSWGCGKRINNGAIGTAPDGSKLKPILKISRDAGKATGLVTTTRITHATPAGFACNVRIRDMEDQIAEQYLERGYDLLMGGGLRHFVAEEREDGRDLLSRFRDQEYEVVQTADELDGAGRDTKLLGLFSDSHIPYAIDREYIDELKASIPSLPQMTDQALNRLSKNPKGFFLMVEGGRVDHGAHDNDVAGLVYDQIEFDKALDRVLKFVDGRDDTLLIVTTDHGTANPGLNGMGSRYTESGNLLERLFRFRRSNTWIFDQIDDSSSRGAIREAVHFATQVEFTDDHAGMLQKAMRDELSTPYSMEQYPDTVLGALLANYVGINWTGTAHTSNYVELAALGPGIESLDNFTRNTELFNLMVETADLGQFAKAGTGGR